MWSDVNINGIMCLISVSTCLCRHKGVINFHISNCFLKPYYNCLLFSQFWVDFVRFYAWLKMAFSIKGSFIFPFTICIPFLFFLQLHLLEFSVWWWKELMIWYIFALFLIFSSVTQLCLAPCDPMDFSTPGFAVHHQLPELAQTHVHWVGDVIKSSHPLSFPSPPAFSPSQHQGLFQWVSSLHQVAKVLEFQLQNQSFQWIFRTDFL